MKNSVSVSVSGIAELFSARAILDGERIEVRFISRGYNEDHDEDVRASYNIEMPLNHWVMVASFAEALLRRAGNSEDGMAFAGSWQIRELVVEEFEYRKH